MQKGKPIIPDSTTFFEVRVGLANKPLLQQVDELCLCVPDMTKGLAFKVLEEAAQKQFALVFFGEPHQAGGIVGCLEALEFPTTHTKVPLQ